MQSNKFLRIIFFLCLVSFFVLSGNLIHTYAAEPPSIDFTVKSSANEYVKPLGADAEGRLDITILPKGMATNEQRKPIEVFFVHDTSGSMADTLDGIRKDKSAQNALSKAVDYFSKNAQPNDKYYFIPFDSEISNKAISECTNFFGCYFYKTYRTYETIGLENIKDLIPDLDHVSKGGTNYSQPLESIVTKTNILHDTKKYVIFLTDGEPTSLYKTENRKKVKYEILQASNGSNVCVKDNQYVRCTDVKNIIESAALQTAETLAENDITMYSIAFAKTGDVNYNLLDTMARKTGGFASEGKTNSLTNLFSDISSQFDSPSINGEITIDLNKFHGKVKVKEDSDAYVDNHNVAHISYNFTFPINKSASPNEINRSLPLTFSEVGKYEFDSIVLKYKDLEGKLVQKVHDPVSITIKDDVAATFKSNTEITGNQFFPSQSLVKYNNSDSESNQFNVKYTIKPTGLVNSNTSGNLNSIKIIQKLPAGVSLVSPHLKVYSGQSLLSGATVKQITDNTIEISVPNKINYAKGEFNITEFAFSLTLKADWAIPYTQLPIGSIHYYDSRFNSSIKEVSLSPSDKNISMKVWIDEIGSSVKYVGDYSGQIQKLDSNSQDVLAQTVLLDKAIKGMELLNAGEKIKLTYFDGTIEELNLKTNFEIKKVNTNVFLKDGDSTEGPAEFKISKLIAGSGVTYEYQLINQSTTTSWTEFDPTKYVPIPESYIGKVDIKVRAKGGFSSSAEPIHKSIVMTRKIQSISVEPNPIQIDVGKSIGFKVDIAPTDAVNKDLNIYIENPSGTNVAALVDGSSVLGQHEGGATLVVESRDGSNIVKRVPITVVNPFVELKDMHFRRAKYTLEVGDEIALYPMLIFNPEGATNKKVSSVTSTNRSAVTVQYNAFDGTWSIIANEVGHSTVKAVSAVKASISDSAVFEVIKKESSDQDTNNSTDGKW